MGTKQLLIIFFLAGSQVVVAGNGMPVKSQSGMDVKSRWKSRNNVDININIDEISIKTDFLGLACLAFKCCIMESPDAVTV